MGVRKVPGEWVPGKAVHGIELEIGHRDPRHAVARPEEVTAHDARHVTALALAEGLGAQDARVADSLQSPGDPSAGGRGPVELARMDSPEIFPRSGEYGYEVPD